jgi:signal peptidase I
MGILKHTYDFLYYQFGDSMFYILGFMVVLSVVALWRLYDKAGQAGVKAIIPVLNAFVFLKIIGRPAWHLLLFFIPVYGQLYLLPKVWIELCQSFGKRTLLDYVLVIVLNGLYIFNLGMSYDTEYYGPVYGKSIAELEAERAHRPSLA